MTSWNKLDSGLVLRYDTENERNSMRLKSILAATAMAAAAGTIVIGCGNSAPAQNYAPMAAYGQGNDCYYAYSPSEVGQLKAAGLCPQNSFSVQAPQSWLDTYYYYYDSPLYYDSYVPAQYRTVYVQKYGPKSSFYHNNQGTITRLSRKATYYSTSGKKVTSVTSTKTFGSGSSFGKAGHSTGSLRVGSTPKSTFGSRANVPGYPGYTPSAKKTHATIKQTHSTGSLRKKSASSGRKR